MSLRHKGNILGFGELKPEGQIDCFYCHQDHVGKGMGTRIYQAIETKAKALKLNTLGKNTPKNESEIAQFTPTRIAINKAHRFIL